MGSRFRGMNWVERLTKLGLGEDFNPYGLLCFDNADWSCLSFSLSLSGFLWRLWVFCVAAKLGEDWKVPFVWIDGIAI